MENKESNFFLHFYPACTLIKEQVGVNTIKTSGVFYADEAKDYLTRILKIGNPPNDTIGLSMDST
ncbi:MULTISPECIES: hypothetical protein [Chryseobacterium]|uniref:hypothetical protein n=1 Tax=Chryseobacterium TaxID=59732 RepID=UPI00235A35FB|nr:MULTISPECIES: hypothetical protein [unclassified Chryseobacterium]MDC8105392.1 hypothetical protein [Chryseobacterium sp. B21-037]MDQ1805646.1 hypothetical protein [Chryseobacterium sp. CKR4-1]